LFGDRFRYLTTDFRSRIGGRITTLARILEAFRQRLGNLRLELIRCRMSTRDQFCG
jgi:hypothetical protein